MEYFKGNFILTQISWNDIEKKLTIQPKKSNNNREMNNRVFKVELIPQGIVKEATYTGKKKEVSF